MEFRSNQRLEENGCITEGKGEGILRKVRESMGPDLKVFSHLLPNSTVGWLCNIWFLSFSNDDMRKFKVVLCVIKTSQFLTMC